VTVLANVNMPERCAAAVKLEKLQILLTLLSLTSSSKI